MNVRIFPSGRVVCEAVIALPMAAGTAWGQLRDFRSSATHDPFHAWIFIHGGIPRAGARLLIEHRYIFYRSRRAGRILRWSERNGFAFSDLCRFDSRRAFPHVISYQLETIDKENCRLRIRVTGRWTAMGPRLLGHIWLGWVFSQVVRTAESRLLMFLLATRWRGEMRDV